MKQKIWTIGGVLCSKALTTLLDRKGNSKVKNTNQSVNSLTNTLKVPEGKVQVGILPWLGWFKARPDSSSFLRIVVSPSLHCPPQTCNTPLILLNQQDPPKPVEILCWAQQKETLASPPNCSYFLLDNNRRLFY